MNAQQELSVNRGIGFKILIIIAILLTFMFLLGQMMAIIDYDFAVSLGLQEPLSEITEVGVALNKGFGFGDTLVYIPLLIVGIAGLIKRTHLGFYAMIGALAITIYWPMVSLSTLYYAIGATGWNFTDYTSYTILLSAIALYGLWGSWYLFRNKENLATIKQH